MIIKIGHVVDVMRRTDGRTSFARHFATKSRRRLSLDDSFSGCLRYLQIPLLCSTASLRVPEQRPFCLRQLQLSTKFPCTHRSSEETQLFRKLDAKIKQGKGLCTIRPWTNDSSSLGAISCPLGKDATIATQHGV